jgi:hypothetical protein
MKYPYHFDMQILLIYVFEALYQNLEDMLDMCRGYVYCRRQIHMSVDMFV